MSTFDFDLFVVGGGSGGVRAARMAASRGARVAMAEVLGVDGLGGTCVNVGCIPKKLYSYAAHYAEAFEESHGFGWEGDAPHLNWDTLKARRAAEISRLNGIYDQMLKQSGVVVMNGFAQLLDAHHVRVDTLNADGSPGHQDVSAAHIVLAPGGTPFVPHFKGREHAITSNEIFDLPEFPRRLLVVGGGYIACEFASIFNGMGAHVTQLYRGEQVLRGFDHEIRHFIAQEVTKAGVDLRLQSDVVSVHREADGLHVALSGGQSIVVDTVLYATGRVPNVNGLGLERVGIAQGASQAIAVNEHFQTNVPNIYALGDVINRVQLTPVALAEAMVVVDHILGAEAQRAPRTISYDCIPTAVFTHPNIGTVGLSEEQAREQYAQVKIFRSEFRALKHTLSGSTERTLMKLVVDAESDRVVGLHMVGADAGEIVQGFAVAMKCGATKAQFDSTIGIHPTAAEEFVTMRVPAAS